MSFTEKSVMRKYQAAVLFALSVLLLAGAPAQAIHPRVNEIRSPLWSTPVFVQPGGEFEISLEAGGRQCAGAELTDAAGGAPVSLIVTGGEATDGGASALSVKVPEDTPEGLYGLKVTFDDGSSDSQPHAVKVLKEFKKDFDFVHVTDIHFNLQPVEGEDTNRIRIQLLKDITELNPEFVLFGGDIGLYPEKYERDYEDAYRAFTEYLDVPFFGVPGNHELYVDNRPDEPIDGRDYWGPVFGPFYGAFDYGGLHVAGINTFDWPDPLRDRWDPKIQSLNIRHFACIGDEQWAWLQQDFSAAKKRGKNIIAFTHIPVELLKGGGRVGQDPSYKVPGPSMNKFFRFLDHFEVSHVFVGHLHFNSERALTGNVTEIMTLGAGNNDRSDNPKWGYRVVHVKDGKITGFTIHEKGFADLD